VAGQTLIPPSVISAEFGCDVHLVYWRIQPHPRVTFSERPRVFRKKPREVRILKITDPLRYSEVTKIDDRIDSSLAKLR
jgi:hypothetical protein